MNGQEKETVNGQTAASGFTAEDIEKNKVISALAYILFFLPLIACPDSPFGKFHANQGLMLLLTSIGASVVLSLIPIVGWIILPFFSLVILVFALIGLVSTLQGKARELPLIGKYRILK